MFFPQGCRAELFIGFLEKCPSKSVDACSLRDVHPLKYFDQGGDGSVIKGKSKIRKIEKTDILILDKYAPRERVLDTSLVVK